MGYEHNPYKPNRIKLACGCTITARNRPLSPRVKYPCPSNMGHGYNVGWTSYVDTGNGSGTDNKGTAVLPPRSVAEKHVADAEPVGFHDVAEGDRLHFGTQVAQWRDTLWRDGTVTEVRPASVVVACEDGTRARLDKGSWSGRSVSRYM